MISSYTEFEKYTYKMNISEYNYPTMYKGNRLKLLNFCTFDK